MANQTNIYSFTPATGFALATELSLKDTMSPEARFNSE